MTERPRPDLGRVRDMMRERDEEIESVEAPEVEPEADDAAEGADADA